MKKQKVLVAMSGGVDSATAAAIVKEQGYDTIAATMKIWPKEYCGRHKERSCCSLKDIEDAKRVCDSLGIRHYVLNFEDVFQKEVIDYFTDEYLSGRTPNPCIVCNEKIKFGRLMKKAEELGCDFIATGHYARVENNGFYKLKESVDKAKDQSYVLFSLTSEQIKKALFPVGAFNKEDVRLKARELGLKLHKKAESQEICFVPDNDYSGFIRKSRGIGIKKGKIVDASGNILGEHDGFWNFTIGQRRGLGISHKTPLYVIGVRPEDNIVVAGDSQEVKKKRFLVRDLNWFKEKHDGEFEADVKIRSTHKKAKAVLRAAAGGRVEVEFRKAQEAITPGQAAVFYEGEYVVGGGWIDRVFA